MEKDEIQEMLDAGWQIVTPSVKFTPDMYDAFLGMFGDEGNYYLLSHSIEEDRNDVFISVGLIVSPEGIANAQSRSDYYNTSKVNSPA